MTHTFQSEKKALWKNKKNNDAIFGLACIAPQLTGFLLFVFYPLVMVFIYSAQSRNLLSGSVSFIGLNNYLQLFANDALFWKTIANTLIFTAGLVPLNIFLALLLALLTAKERKSNVFFRTVFFAPVVTSAVAWSIVWRFLLQGEQGIVNTVIASFGLHGPDWLREGGWAMSAVIGTRVIKNLGMNIIIYLAAVTNLPTELYEAARIDGAGIVQQFRKLTIPLLMPTTLMIAIITVIGSLKVFDQIMLMTGGGPDNSTMVLVYYIYYQGFQMFETGYASALASILFIIVLGLTIAQWSLRKKLAYQEV